jgi:hypothetical protein
MSLLSEREAIVLGNLGSDFPPTWLSSTIEDQEQDYFDREMSMEFYDALIADLVEYPQGDPYDSDQIYAIDDIVLYDGFLYRSLTAANQNNQMNDTDHWVKVPKFGTPVYDQLWYRYLGRILAMEVSLPASVYSTYKASRNGLMKTSSIETGAQALNKGEISSWKETIRNQISKATKFQRLWIVKQTEADGYADQFALLSWACRSMSRPTKIGGRRFFLPNKERLY